MLFILGTKSHNVKNGQINNFDCPKCSNKTQLNYSLFRRYTHVTLIPLFPVDKEIIVACNHCEEIIAVNDLQEITKADINKIRNESYSATPLWMYAGTVVIILAIIFGIYSYLNNKDNSKAYLTNPIEGDVYNLKLSNGFYTTQRIDKITNDSIFVTANDYNAYLPYETDDIDKPENYSNSKVKYSKKEVIVLFNKDEIYSITRN